MASTLNVAGALKNPGQEYSFEADARLEEMEVLGDPVRFDEIAVRGVFTGTEDTVNVDATVTARVTSRCARCLTEVVLPISAPLRAEFAHQPDPDDPDQYRFEASTLELDEAVKDALVLELPIRFLCSEDCKGLCPRCGANLNTGSCSCRKEADDDNPFAALRSLVKDDEEV